MISSPNEKQASLSKSEIERASYKKEFMRLQKQRSHNSSADSFDQRHERNANEKRMQLQQSLLEEAFHLLSRKRDIPIVTTDDENNLVQH